MDTEINHLHILCYRWGTRYPVLYVNNLRAMVARNLRLPHTFHCVTDSKEGLSSEVVDHPLDTFVAGNWNKLQTFREDFLGLKGSYLVCMDLDIVIVDDLSFLTHAPGEPFMIGKNWSKGIRGNSSVYRIKVGEFPHVWNDFIVNKEANIEHHHGKNRSFGDQNWLNHKIENYAYFPDGKIVSFKRQCRAKGRCIGGELGSRIGLTTALFGKASPPPGASIIAFHGQPLPPDVMYNRYGCWRHAPFVAQHWHS